MLNTVFLLIVAALSTAFAISFGIGGRDFAGKVLKKLETACKLEQDEEK